MARYRKEDIFQMVEEEGVEFIQLQFTDIFGMAKNVAITLSQLDKALNNQCTFDGSCIEGLVRMEESDMYLYPDLDTFEIFPWLSSHGKVARLICDVYNLNQMPFEGDPRYVLKRVLEDAKKMGYTFLVSPQCEFFLFHTDEEGRPTTKTHEMAGYFDVGPIDFGESVRRDIVMNLEQMGLSIEASHHEIAPGQHEIDFEYAQGLTTADHIMTFRMVAKTIAKHHGLHATFMPKPKGGVDGSGMHMNLLLIDQCGKNVFSDNQDSLGVSQVGYHFMAGVLHYMKEMMALTNPLVNSYKRLIPGYDASIYIAWSATANHSTLMQVPLMQGEKTRIELRCPDPSMNPYLALAAYLAAGLDGIKKKMVPPCQVPNNIFHMTGEQMKQYGIVQLPETLGEAIGSFRESGFMKEVLGEGIYTKYLEAKQEEWKHFCSHVSDWEIAQYLYRF